MAFLSTEIKTKLEARKARIEAQLDVAYDALLQNGDTKEYRIDTGGGSQRVEYTDAKGMLKIIDILERTLSSVCNRLDGTGVVNINLRRR